VDRLNNVTQKQRTVSVVTEAVGERLKKKTPKGQSWSGSLKVGFVENGGKPPPPPHGTEGIHSKPLTIKDQVIHVCSTAVHEIKGKEKKGEKRR